MKMQNRFEMKGENFVHSVLNYILYILFLNMVMIIMMNDLVEY